VAVDELFDWAYIASLNQLWNSIVVFFNA
jgi:hypothetical protein